VTIAELLALAVVADEGSAGVLERVVRNSRGGLLARSGPGTRRCTELAARALRRRRGADYGATARWPNCCAMAVGVREDAGKRALLERRVGTKEIGMMTPVIFRN
jgi:tight adherence protein C